MTDSLEFSTAHFSGRHLQTPPGFAQPGTLLVCTAIPNGLAVLHDTAWASIRKQLLDVAQREPHGPTPQIRRLILGNADETRLTEAGSVEIPPVLADWVAKNQGNVVFVVQDEDFLKRYVATSATS